MIQPHDSLIVQKISRLLVPLIQLFAFYVFFHGHHSPGGGFQGGVLLGASLILRMLVGNDEPRDKSSLEGELVLGTFGLVIYAGIGVVALFCGGNYLNYGEIVPLSSKTSYRRFLGILGVEAGVMLVVSMTLVLIFRSLAQTKNKDSGS